MAGPRIEQLERLPLFSELGRKDLRRIAGAMGERRFESGAAVAREGEVGVGFFVIAAGQAIVSVRGREVNRLGPGDHFGDIALIIETARTATVTAETELQCWTLASWDFRRLVENNAAVCWKIAEALAQRLVRGERLE